MTDKPRVSTYQYVDHDRLVTSTRVRFADGYTVYFAVRQNKRDAVRLATESRARFEKERAAK